MKTRSTRRGRTGFRAHAVEIRLPVRLMVVLTSVAMISRFQLMTGHHIENVVAAASKIADQALRHIRIIDYVEARWSNSSIFEYASSTARSGEGEADLCPRSISSSEGRYSTLRFKRPARLDGG